MLGFAFLASLLSPPAFGAGVTVRFVGEPEAYNSAVGPWYQAVSEEWAKKTGNKLEYIGRPNDYSAVLPLFQQQWAAKSPDVDIYQIDVVCQGIAAPHAVDLKKYCSEDELKAYFPRIIENNTVGGKLVSIPLFTDAGILYYRTDLLEKYGYKEPPKTWEELAVMAKKIQDGERAAGKPDFQGFVFEGKAMLDVFHNAVARPSTVTGADYNQLSTAFSQNVNKVLTGTESGKDAVDQIERVAKSIVH
jgi:trehalose/maltose transport system substrate-binding protein